MSQEERAEELASELEEANDLLRDARTQFAHFAQRAEQAERALADAEIRIRARDVLLNTEMKNCADLRTQLHAAQEALQEIGRLVGRFRAHRSECTAECTCDAIMDEKLLRAEVSRVAFLGWAALSPRPE